MGDKPLRDGKGAASEGRASPLERGQYVQRDRR
jgi:hypothetical protein